MSKTIRREHELQDEELVQKAETKSKRKNRPAGRFLAMIEEQIEELNLGLADAVEQIRYEPAPWRRRHEHVNRSFFETDGILLLDEMEDRR